MDRSNTNAVQPIPPAAAAEDIKALAHVLNTALKSKLNGQTQKYTLILQQLRTGTDAILYKLFLALQRCVPDISTNIHNFDDLFHILLHLKYRPIPMDAVQALTNTQSILNNVSSVLSSNTVSSSTANAITSSTVLSSTPSASTSNSACMYSLTTVQAYTRLLQALVTTNPANFLLPVCRTLIRGLTSTQQDADTYALLRAKNTVLNTTAASSNEAFPKSQTPYELLSLLPFPIIKEISSLLSAYNDIIYSSLYTILANVPTGITSLFTTLAEAIPHKRLSVFLYETYIRHTLRLITLIPSLRDRMIAAIIDRMVDLDVDIILDLLPDIDEDNNGTTTVPILERSESPTTAGTETNNIDILTDETKQTEEDITRQATIQTATKLDTIFLLMLRYLHGSICSCGGSSFHSTSIIPRNNDNNNETTAATHSSLSSSSEISKLLSSNGIRPNPDPILDSDNGLSCQCISQRLQQVTGHGSSMIYNNHDTLSAIDKRNNDNLEVREHMFALMLGVFERSVLLTHRSKFIQFLLFYTCALDNSFTDRFVGRLVTHIRNPERSPLWRATSAVYLGSFLARAATVDNTTVRSALYYMLEWAHGYVDLWDAHVSYSIQMMVVNGELDNHPHHRTRGVPQSSATVDMTVSTSLIWENGSSSSSSSSSANSDDSDTASDEEDDSSSGISNISSTSSSSSSSFTSSSHSSDASRSNSSSNDDEDIDYHLIAPHLIPRYMDPELPPLPLPSLFHSIMQATFYVICFRAAEFRLLAGGVDFLANLQWDKLLESPLDPLAHCSEAVAREFARIVHVLRLAPHASLVTSAAYDILTSSHTKATNNKDNETEDVNDETKDITDQSTTVPRSNGILMENTAMESFFPFDPFLLKDSSRYIAPIFRTWTASSIGFGIDTTFDWTETEGYDTTGVPKQPSMFSSGTESVGTEGGNNSTLYRRNHSSGNESVTKRPRRNSYSEVLHRRKVSVGNESMELTDDGGSLIEPPSMTTKHRNDENDENDDGSSGESNDIDNQEDELEDEDNEIILPLPLSNAQEQILSQTMDNCTSLLARMRAGLSSTTTGTVPVPSSNSLFTGGSLSASILAPGLVAALDNAQATDGLLANLDIDINEYGFRNNRSSYRSKSSTDDTDDDDEDDEDETNGSMNNTYLSPYHGNPYHRKTHSNINEEDDDNDDDDDNESNSVVSSNAPSYTKQRKASEAYTLNSSPTGTNASSSLLGSPQNSPWLGSHSSSLRGLGIGTASASNGGQKPNNDDEPTNNNNNGNSISLMLPPTLYTVNSNSVHGDNTVPSQRSSKPPTHSRKVSQFNNSTTNSAKSTPLLHGRSVPSEVEESLTHLSANDRTNNNTSIGTNIPRKYSTGSNISVTSRISSNNTTENINIPPSQESNGSSTMNNISSSSLTGSTTGTTRRKKSIAGFETGTVIPSSSGKDNAILGNGRTSHQSISSALVGSNNPLSSETVHFFAGVGITSSLKYSPAAPSSMGGTPAQVFTNLPVMPVLTSLNKRKLSEESSSSSSSVDSLPEPTNNDNIPRSTILLQSATVANNNPVLGMNTSQSTSPALNSSSTSNAPSWETFASMMSTAADQIKSTEAEEEDKDRAKTKNNGKSQTSTSTDGKEDIDNGKNKGKGVNGKEKGSFTGITSKQPRTKRSKKE